MLLWFARSLDTPFHAWSPQLPCERWVGRPGGWGVGMFVPYPRSFGVVLPPPALFTPTTWSLTAPPLKHWLQVTPPSDVTSFPLEPLPLILPLPELSDLHETSPQSGLSTLSTPVHALTSWSPQSRTSAPFEALGRHNSSPVSFISQEKSVNSVKSRTSQLGVRVGEGRSVWRWCPRWQRPNTQALDVAQLMRHQVGMPTRKRWWKIPHRRPQMLQVDLGWWL